MFIPSVRKKKTLTVSNNFEMLSQSTAARKEKEEEGDTGSTATVFLSPRWILSQIPGRNRLLLVCYLSLLNFADNAIE